MLSNPDSYEESSEGFKADDELTATDVCHSDNSDSVVEKGMKNLSLNSIETKADIHTRRKSFNSHRQMEIHSQTSLSSVESVGTESKKKRSASVTVKTTENCEFSRIFWPILIWRIFFSDKKSGRSNSFVEATFGKDVRKIRADVLNSIPLTTHSETKMSSSTVYTSASGSDESNKSVTSLQKRRAQNHRLLRKKSFSLDGG